MGGCPKLRPPAVSDSRETGDSSLYCFPACGGDRSGPAASGHTAEPLVRALATGRRSSAPCMPPTGHAPGTQLGWEKGAPGDFGSASCGPA